MSNINKFYNANFAERLVFNNEAKGEKEEYLVFVQSGNKLQPEALEHSMSQWKVRKMDNDGVGIESTYEEKFDNCHAAHNNHGGEYRYGKANAIYGIVFVFDLKELDYIGQGYLLKVRDKDTNEETIILEGVQTGHQSRSLTLGKIIMEIMTGESWEQAKTCVTCNWSHHTWLGCENGHNYVKLKSFKAKNIALEHPGHSVDFKKAFADISGFEWQHYLEENDEDETDNDYIHTVECDDCRDELDSQYWAFDSGDALCDDCMIDRIYNELPSYVISVDCVEYAEREFSAVWHD